MLTQVCDQEDRLDRAQRTVLNSSIVQACRYKFNADPADAFDWLKPLTPVARIGASLRLYFVPER